MSLARVRRSRDAQPALPTCHIRGLPGPREVRRSARACGRLERTLVCFPWRLMVMRATRRSSPFGLILTLLAALCAQAAMAGVVMESPAAPREIKACILSAGGIQHPSLFIQLQRAQVCPEGWRFVNPLATPEYTSLTGQFKGECLFYSLI